MMNSHSAKLLLVTLLAALSACKGTGAPSCSDSDVTSTAIGMLGKGLPYQFLDSRLQYGRLNGNISEECWTRLNENLNKLDLTQIETLKVNDTCIDHELDNAREFLAKVESEGISEIRTTARDDDLKKVTCVGKFAGSTMQYGAQYTEDGQTYVEIYQ